MADVLEASARDAGDRDVILRVPGGLARLMPTGYGPVLGKVVKAPTATRAPEPAGPTA